MNYICGITFKSKTMKTIISKEELLCALEKCARFTADVLPIAQCVKISVLDGKVFFYSTSLEVHFSTYAPALSVEKEGDICVPVALLMRVVKTLGAQPLVISADVNLKFTLQHATGKIILAGENPADFPQMPEQPKGDYQFLIDSDVLGDMCKKALPFCSADELRPAMTGVYLCVNAQGVTTAATNAHILIKNTHAEKIDFSGENEENYTGILRPDLVKFLASYKTKSQYFFTCEGIKVLIKIGSRDSIFCLNIDANFPDYNAVMPSVDSIKNKLVVDSKATQAVLNRLALLAPQGTNLVRLDCQRGSLTAIDYDFDNEVTEYITAEYMGEEMPVKGFNGKLLKTCLGCFDGQVDFLVDAQSAKPCLFIQEQTTALIMPVLINDPQPEEPTPTIEDKTEVEVPANVPTSDELEEVGEIEEEEEFEEEGTEVGALYDFDEE